MPAQVRSAPEASGWRSASSLALAAGFSLTGAGTVMLGVLLPALSQKWGLHDSGAGLLLFLQFSGSSLGAVFTGSDRLRALRTGYGLLTIASGALAFADKPLAFPLFFFFGLGLGMAMTSTSLLFSDRFESDRAAKLEGLNFAWSAGAMAAPLFFLPFTSGAHLRVLFFALEALFLLLLGWALLGEKRSAGHSSEGPSTSASGRPVASLPLLLALTMCAVGVETSLSGWLTTLLHRLAPDAAAGISLPVTLFYLGVVLSRLAFTTPLLARIGSLRAVRSLVWILAASLALLILAYRPGVVHPAAAITGLCVGPLYPLLLAFLLERASRGWVFAFAGVGSALFPWLTGIVSAHFGSLRYGLAVPFAGALVMIILWSAAARALGRTAQPAASLAGR